MCLPTPTWRKDPRPRLEVSLVRPIIDHMPDRNAHDRHDEEGKKDYREKRHGGKVTAQARDQVDASAIRLAHATGCARTYD
jgi:hypothetical protein